MTVRGRPPSGSWSGVLFTSVRDCLLKCVGVPVNFPVKNWFAPDNFTQRRASISQLDSYAIEAPYSWELKAFLSHFQVTFTDNRVGNSIDELGMQKTLWSSSDL